jgi:cytochrome o ubiquinol oxidase operon protein cyoD
MQQAPTDIAGGSLRSYAAGFILSVVLTAAAFALVVSGVSRSAVLLGISAAAVVQIVVHLHYFLHLGTSPTARWNVTALIFALLVMALFVGGTIWIMYRLYYRLL